MNSRLIIYKASAGSGKTFTLAANYISYLLVNPEAYRHILAVTFTNKATGEMKERILSQLYGISRSLPKSEVFFQTASALANKRSKHAGQPSVFRENAGKALTSILHHYSEFRIETIDSFMLSILRGLAKELELGHSMEIELDTESVLKEGVHGLIEGLGPDSPEMGAIIEFIQSVVDEDRDWDVRKKLTYFAKNLHKEAFLRHSEELDTLLKEHPDTFVSLRRSLRMKEERVRKDTKTVAESFFNLCNRLGAIVDDFNDKRKSPYPIFEKAIEGEPPEITDAKRKYATGEKAWGHKKSKLYDAIEAESDTLSNMLNTLIGLRREMNTIELVRKNLYQLQLIENIDNHVSTTCREENRFLLAVTCLMLMKMASEPGDTSFIYEKTGTQIDHILIDEFQDTSGLQWANFRPLLSENASRGMQGLIVGDVKQAIYRWRDSDADIIARKVEEDLQMADPHTELLKVNRRSRRGIVEFNNRFFSKLISELEIRHEELRLRNYYADVEQEWLPEKEGGNVKILEVKDEMPEQVAEQVKELLDAGVKPRDIAILIRENKYIVALAEWFESHPEALAPHTARLVSGEAFKLDSSEAIRMLIGAMRWVHDEKDSVSLVQTGIAYHRHVLCDGLALSDILALPNRQYGLPEAFVNQHETLSALPLGKLAYALYYVLEMRRMEGQSAWMQSFFDIVQRFAAEKTGNLQEFLTEWDEKLYKTAIPSGEADGIACMTIHKAKGLEWDSVILPYCNWPFEKPGSTPTLWVEPADPTAYEGLPFLPINRSKAMKESDFAAQYDKETKQIWIDNLNLLYVAFTRPKTNLVILKEPKKSSDTITTIGDFIELGLKELRNEELEIRNDTEERSQAQPTPDSTNPLLPQSETLGVGFHAAPIQLPFRQSNSSRTFINRGDDSPLSEFIERGNLLHEVFAHIHTADDAPRAIEELFTQGIIDATQRDDITQTVSEALHQPAVSDWFSGHYELFNECTILTKEDGEVKQNRPDRVMCSKDKTIVVDFKFGQSRDEHHRQVGAYMSLLRQMGFKGVEGYLWYVTQQKIVRV